jgi:hypothetical protein
MIESQAPFYWQNYQEYEDGSYEFLGLTYHKKRDGVVLDTPRMIGWAILDYAKMVMLRFHYSVMKVCFADLKLLMTDTDSLYYLIRSAEDPTEEMRRLNLAGGSFAVFDLSEFKRYDGCQNTKKLGTFKVECGDNTIEGFVGLGPKSYCKKTAKGQERKYKGLDKRTLKRLYNFEAYKRALLTNNSDCASFLTFRSVDHVVRHCQMTRKGLSADNDKVYMVSPYESRPLNHRLNHVKPNPPDNDWDLDDSDEELYNMALANLPMIEEALDPNILHLENDDDDEPPAESEGELEE